ncbi:uncharacterized protein J4E78_008859 [Alternaria triticimaculans]|uniref:uncharacterized protein n=1 Tax=Alternaria triticimaculans TaxID=297637 RepID=UPI0020C309F1|nr:uncharacterized protein J4E78_008859 [Alternaria triticimaculans]KAI4647544.1 hypothetical protein J4E78_008859 [Alternaria triticimaculans]
MEDFVNIVATAKTDRHHSWLEGHQLELAMALLTLVQKKRTDILFVPTNAGIILARIGLCVDDKDRFKKDALSIYEAMQQEEYRWIVIPVTDGMADERTAKRIMRWRAKTAKAKDQGETGEEEQVRQEVSKEAEVLVTNKEGDPNGNTEVQQESEPEMTSSGGTHWGFMVIDKERNDARWLDGHLNVKQKRNKHWYIHNMHKPHPAWVAGKILCGYDKVMELERGAFTAATLKHVPHDTKDNSYRGDEGSACGPWVYAMLKYILDNPRFLTDAGGLCSAFSSRYRRKHPQKMAFNSLQTRRDMQEIIRKEADKDLGENVLPYKMSVRVVQILSLPSTGQLCDAVASLNPNRRTPPGPGDNRSSRNGPGSDGDSSDGDDDGWPDEHDGVSRAQYQMYLQEGEPYSRNRLDEVVKAFKENQDDIARNFQRRKHGVLTKNPEYKFPKGFSKDNLPAFDQLKMDSSEPWYATYKDDLLKVDDSRSLALQTSRAVLHSVFKGSFRSENAAVLRDYLHSHAFTFAERSQTWTSETIAERLDQTYLDLALPLFASLSNAGVDIWVKNLHPTAQKVVQDAVGVTRYDVARGLLYRMFIGEFADMTDRDVDEWRASDPHMLEAGKQDLGVARWWLTWYYYQGDAMEKLPYLAESPLHWPPREYREVHGQKRKRGGEEVDGGDDPNAGQPSSGPNDASNIAQPDPTTIQWATIDHATLMKHATKEIREDPRIGELSNDYTYRAILFVKHGGTFKNEKDRAGIWIRDLNVFTLGSEDKIPKRDVYAKDGRLVIRPTQAEILKRMKEKYEKTSSKPVSTAKKTPSGRKGPLGPKGPPGSQKPAKTSKTSKPSKPSKPSKTSTHPKATSQQSPPQPELPNILVINSMLAQEIANFTHMANDQVEEFVDLLPSKIAETTRPMDTWGQKSVLQKLFSTYEDLSQADMEVWLEHPIFEGRQEVEVDEMVAKLNESVKELGNISFKGVSSYYPKSYVYEAVARNSVNSSFEPVVAQPESLNPGDLNGLSESEEEEFESESDVEDEPEDTATGAKRKRAQAEADARAKKRRKGEAPDFRDMKESDLALWVKELPSEVRKPLLDDIGETLLSMKAHIARCCVERIYKKTFQTWAAEDPLTDASVKEIRLWRSLGTFDQRKKYAIKNTEGLKNFCEEQLFPQTRLIDKKSVELPDYSNDKDKWPEEWK